MLTGADRRQLWRRYLAGYDRPAEHARPGWLGRLWARWIR